MAVVLNTVGDNIPPVVFAVVIAPLGLIKVAIGFGTLAVGTGINATSPEVASLLITAPPKSIVLPLRYKLLKRCVGVPKSYVMLAVGVMCELTKILPTVDEIFANVIPELNTVPLAHKMLTLDASTRFAVKDTLPVTALDPMSLLTSTQ